MKTTLKVTRRRSATDGTERIYYHITCGGNTRYVSARISAAAAQDNGPQTTAPTGGDHANAPARDNRARNIPMRKIPARSTDCAAARIEDDMIRLRCIDEALKRTGRRYSAQEIADRFRAARRGVTLLAFIDESISRLTADGHFGTARNYASTRNSLAAFLGGRDMPLAAVTDRTVEEYGAFLRRRGVVRNTLSFYMRILRSIYNKAVRRHLVEQRHPFAGVYTGIDRTRKRAVDEDAVRRLRALDLAHSPALALARDIFVFSYCTRGMSFVDVAFLRRDNIRNGVLRYVRRKTGQRISVRIEACIGEIIDRHHNAGSASPYLFPLLTAHDERTAYAQYQVALNYYNRLLKRLSAMIRLDAPLSSYTPRHSWATAAYRHNVPINVISAGMGHTSERTTQIYLAEIESSVIDSANRGIIESLDPRPRHRAAANEAAR